MKRFLGLFLGTIAATSGIASGTHVALGQTSPTPRVGIYHQGANKLTTVPAGTPTVNQEFSLANNCGPMSLNGFVAESASLGSLAADIIAPTTGITFMRKQSNGELWGITRFERSNNSPAPCNAEQLTGYLNQPGNIAISTGWRVVGMGRMLPQYPAKKQLIWYNPNQQQIAIWDYTSTGVNWTIHNTGVPTNSQWRVKAVADVTGNGYGALVWRDDATGQTSFFPWNGSSFLPGIYMNPQFVPLNFRLVGAVECNSAYPCSTPNAKSRLVWQDLNSANQTFFDLNSSAALIGSGYLQGQRPAGATNSVFPTILIDYTPNLQPTTVPVAP